MEILRIGGARLALVVTPSISVDAVQTSARDGRTHFKDVSVGPPPTAMPSESALLLERPLAGMRLHLVVPVAALL
jgi:hypothetical protein